MSEAWAELGGARPASPQGLSLGEQLLIANTLAALQGVRTEPGSGDLQFIRELRGKRPNLLSERQRDRVLRLAWRYRFQLPVGLRPAAKPSEEN